MRLKEMTKPIFIVSLVLLIAFESCDHDRPGPKPCGDGEIAAADATWSYGEGDLQNTKRAPNLRQKGCFSGPAETPSVQWSLDLSGSGTAGAPVIGDDGTIYLVGEYPGQPKFGGIRDAGLLAINPNGSIKWYLSRPIDVSIIYAKSVALGRNGTIYCSMWDSTFYALNPADGSVKWSRKGVFTADPIVDNNGRIYAASDTVFCLNSDGSVAWFYANDTPGDYVSRLVPGRKAIYCGYWHGGINALSFSGNREWFHPVYLDNDLHSGMVVDEDDNLYYKTSYNNIEALDRSGHTKWSVSRGSMTEPVLWNNHIYFLDAAFLYRIDCKAGFLDSLLAIDDVDLVRFWSSPLIDDSGQLFFVGGSGVLYAYDLDDRQRLWKLTIPNYGPADFIGHLGLSAMGTLYVTSYNNVEVTQINRIYSVR